MHGGLNNPSQKTSAAARSVPQYQLPGGWPDRIEKNVEHGPNVHRRHRQSAAESDDEHLQAARPLWDPEIGAVDVSRGAVGPGVQVERQSVPTLRVPVFMRKV